MSDFLDRMMREHMMPALYVCFFILMFVVYVLAIVWEWVWKKFMVFAADKTPAWVNSLPLQTRG
jgi:hypothetical protein